MRTGRDHSPSRRWAQSPFMPASSVASVIFVALYLLGLAGTPVCAQYTQTIIHNPESPSPPTGMGWAVAGDGDTFAIGLPNIGKTAPGAVQVWRVDESGVWNLEAELTGDSPTDSDQFGWSIALDGDTLVVGARRADETDVLQNRGAAYIFSRSEGVWTQEARLKLSDPDVWPPVYFGHAVAISGDTVIVSAWNNSVIEPPGAAALYSYTRSGGVWSLHQKVTVSGTLVGSSVAISGNLMMAGEGGGGVYTFERGGTGWNAIQALPGSSSFGSTLVLDGSFALIGAPFESISGVSVGAVHVYERSNRIWTKKQSLNAVDWAFDDQFGSQIAMAGDTIFIGARGDDDIEFNSGSVYVFRPLLGEWHHRQTLKATDPCLGQLFGVVAASAEFAIIGAPEDTGRGYDIGEAYIFANSPEGWTPQGKLSPQRDTGRLDQLGRSIVVDGNFAFFGVPSDCERALGAGAVYVFARPFGFWIPHQKLIASDGTPFDGFGSSIATSGDTLFVGMQRTNGPYEPGAAYAFRRNLSGMWTEEQIVASPNPNVLGTFGSAVALSGETAFIGDSREVENSITSGAVYVFNRTQRTWTQGEKLVPSDGEEDDYFGRVISASGDRLIVGTAGKGSTGAAYIFSKSDGSWSEEQKLSFSRISLNDQIGISVAISGDEAFVGAPGEDLAATDSGAVYAFKLVDGIWTERQMLLPTVSSAFDGFGTALSISGGSLVVTSDNHREDTTAASLFTSSAGVWSEVERFAITDPGVEGFVGSPVAISEGSIFLSLRDGLELYAGAVYVYSPPAVLPASASDSWTLFE